MRFPQGEDKTTKRGVLRTVAKVYDPIGVVSPMTLGGKLLYRDVCDLKIPWDQELSPAQMREWSKWESNLPEQVSFLRPIPRHREAIINITLHGFGDASAKGVCAAVYAVITQASGVSVALVTSNSRLAKRLLSILRLELVSAHMVTNLIVNRRAALLD